MKTVIIPQEFGDQEVMAKLDPLGLERIRQRPLVCKLCDVKLAAEWVTS